MHIAPGCGKEDFALAKPNGLAILAPIDESGVYLDGYDWLTGQYAGDVAEPIALSGVANLQLSQHARVSFPAGSRCERRAPNGAWNGEYGNSRGRAGAGAWR